MKNFLNRESAEITRTFNQDYFYGEVYSDYDNFYDWENYASELIDRHTFTSLLDVGCGCGNLVKAIKSKKAAQGSGADHDIQGVDASAFAVHKANVPFVQLADCRDLPFTDKQFDMVYVLTTFSYLPSLDDIKLAIREAYRVASRLIVFDDVYSVPSKDSYEYDPERRIVYFQDQWLSYWQEVIGAKDSVANRDYEIVIHKHGS